MFAADIKRQRISRMKGYTQWRWHVDECFVKINGETHYLWRAVEIVLEAKSMAIVAPDTVLQHEM